jgi:hypothetical protein
MKEEKNGGRREWRKGGMEEGRNEGRAEWRKGEMKEERNISINLYARF